MMSEHLIEDVNENILEMACKEKGHSRFSPKSSITAPFSVKPQGSRWRISTLSIILDLHVAEVFCSKTPLQEKRSLD